MTKKIYGIDLEQEVTPLMVRDAIIECFTHAHCMDAGISEDDKNINNMYCREVVNKAFSDSGGNFDNPTKEDILKVLENLSSFSKKFRDQNIIERHYKEIMKLVNSMK